MKSFCPFDQKVFIPEKRIERICCDALQSVWLMPEEPEPVRIDRLIEKLFKIEIEYTDLNSRFGAGVMGACAFNRDGSVARVLVDQSLETDERTGEVRIRSTLAHEAGHGLLHGTLFAQKFQADAEIAANRFGDSSRPSLMPDGFACRLIGNQATAYEWWEVQANKAKTELLLPRSLVTRQLRVICRPQRGSPSRMPSDIGSLQCFPNNGSHSHRSGF